MEEEWEVEVPLSAVTVPHVSTNDRDTVHKRPSRVTIEIQDPEISELLGASEISVSGTQVLANELLKGKRNADNVKSKIFRGGIHLRRLLAYKDVLIPSGPAASVMGTVFNLSNATVGAGILSMGLAVSKIGLVLAPCLMVAVAIASGWSNGFLLQAAQATEPRSRSIPVTAYRSFGLGGSIFIDVLLILSGFGSLCAYYVLLADFLTPVASAVLSPTSIVATERIVAMGLAALAGVLPLAMKKDINSLQGSSITSMGLVAFILVGVTILCAQGIAEGMRPASYVLANVDFGFFFTFPMILFGYSNTSAVMPIFVEMADQTISNFRKVMGFGGAIVTLAYALMGTISYARFGGDIAGNLLNNFPPDSTLITLVRASFAFTIITTYPLVLFPLRLAIEHLLLGIKRPFSSLEFYFVTLLILIGSFIVAATVSDVSLIFGLTGSLGSALMMFFVPPVLYLRIVPNKHWIPLIGAILMTIFGLGIAGLGVYSFADSITMTSANMTNSTIFNTTQLF